MTDTDILIANYQSIIRVLAGQVRALEQQLHGDAPGCFLRQAECAALDEFITNNLDCYVFRKEHGKAELDFLLVAWDSIRKGAW